MKEKVPIPSRLKPGKISQIPLQNILLKYSSSSDEQVGFFVAILQRPQPKITLRFFCLSDSGSFNHKILKTP
jgi:hypothetical protein